VRSGPRDPIAIGARPYASGTVTFEFTKNYKFTILNNEKSGQGDERVVNEKVRWTKRWTN